LSLKGIKGGEVWNLRREFTRRGGGNYRVGGRKGGRPTSKHILTRGKRGENRYAGFYFIRLHSFGGEGGGYRIRQSNLVGVGKEGGNDLLGESTRKRRRHLFHQAGGGRNNLLLIKEQKKVGGGKNIS